MVDLHVVEDVQTIYTLDFDKIISKHIEFLYFILSIIIYLNQLFQVSHSSVFFIHSISIWSQICFFLNIIIYDVLKSYDFIINYVLIYIYKHDDNYY